MPIDRSEVKHIATLARIALTEEEVELLREQLSHILEQFEVLKELDTAGVTPTGGALQLRAAMRDDIPGESLAPEEVLRNAPRQEGGFFRVKAVLEE
jgi:aspartyl-tRNA(Asn)/glutamyl-tRNA(Gln) amidotransferase subunit C